MKANSASRSRAATPPLVTARWQDLLLLNFPVPPALLEPHLPWGTELDFWQGESFVSVVGFRFLDARLRGRALWGHQAFDEVNLRFYVRRQVAGQTRRGVVFIREICNRPAVSWLAWLLYGEQYRSCRMVRVAPRRDDPSGVAQAAYGWTHRGRWCRLDAELAGEPELPADDSSDAFFLEHYYGYTRRGRRRTLEYRVTHPRWLTRRVTRATFTGDPTGVYGAPLAQALRGGPASAIWAEGSAVAIDRPCWLGD